MSSDGRLERASLLILVSAALSGCVAAAALPVLAGGSMLNSEAVIGERPINEQNPQIANPRASASQTDGLVLVSDLSELPAPAEADIAIATRDRQAARSFDSFYGYALGQAALDPLEAPMRSALLENPGSLEPVRQQCAVYKPLVAIDLDPGETQFDPANAGTANHALAEVLAVLRTRGLTVAWLSDAPAEQLDAIRAALATSGLDRGGGDLILLAEGGSSKQERRQALAETACPVAFAGDRREDFDELYAYLKNPDAALGLNEMFGAGWFLTPNPID